MEGLILLPTGLYSYPGAIQALSFNAGTYYQWPVYEGLMWAGVQTALCCLRFFTDDRGRTIVERGLDHVRGGFVTQQLTRFLAIFAAVSACFFIFFNIPIQFFAMHADPWPEDHHEAVLLHQRHLRRGHRHAMPRSGAAVADKGVRLHQHRR